MAAGTGPLKINASDLMQSYEDAVAAAAANRQPSAQQAAKTSAWGASSWTAAAAAPVAHSQWGGPQWSSAAPAGRAAWGDGGGGGGGGLSPRVWRDMPRPGQGAPATEAERRRALALADQVVTLAGEVGETCRDKCRGLQEKKDRELALRLQRQVGAALRIRSGITVLLSTLGCGTRGACVTGAPPRRKNTSWPTRASKPRRTTVDARLPSWPVPTGGEHCRPSRWLLRRHRDQRTGGGATTSDPGPPCRLRRVRAPGGVSVGGGRWAGRLWAPLGRSWTTSPRSCAGRNHRRRRQLRPTRGLRGGLCRRGKVVSQEGGAQTEATAGWMSGSLRIHGEEDEVAAGCEETATTTV
jgi:hypothetical protein